MTFFSRLLQLAFVLLGVSVLAFLLIHLIPGDAAQLILGAEDITPEKLAAVRAELGLDRPLVVQYAIWLGRVLRGDLGVSISTGRPVLEEIAGRVGVTAELAVLSLTVAVVLALPLGAMMAVLRGSAADAATRVLTIMGITMPGFWLGTMLLYGADALAPGVPLIGWVAFGEDPLGNLQRMILPVTALALPVLAGLARVFRAAMQEVLLADYVRTARAKGLGEAVVVFRHAAANALIPFITSAGIMAGYLFGGAVVIEQVFALPGLGRLMVGAIAERNYPLLQAALLLATAAFVAVNFAVDLLYRAVDPRAR
jgi:peptide/nickel transport system permease protein